jgi:hypothetical protein
MDPLNTASDRRVAMRLLVATLLTASASGCASDARTPAGPHTGGIGAMEQKSIASDNAIIVTTSAELVAALVPENAGRRILVRAGSYDIDQALVVPDSVTLEGEGVMQLDEAKLPIGLRADTRTTLAMVAFTPGNFLTLGDGVVLRQLAIEDLPGRVGNAVGIVSRRSGDRVSATIEDIEILNPNLHGVAPLGPTGCGIVVLTLNPNLGGDPPPHAGAVVEATVTRSLIRSPATGSECGLFPFNFAPQAAVSVTLSDNVIGGGMDANGGVSRPDAVYDSKTVVLSRHNLYRDDAPDACVSQSIGWKLTGGSGTPVPLPNPGAKRNALRVHSQDDRIEGFTNAIIATAGRRFFAAPLAGPSDGNSIDLELLGTNIVTPGCGGAAFVSDIQLFGATGDASTIPGEGNTLRAVIRGVTGSGARANVFADILGPNGPLPGTAGNRLEIVGSQSAFAKSNRAIEPGPGASFYTSAGQ